MLLLLDTTGLYLEKKLILLSDTPSFTSLKNELEVNSSSIEMIRDRKFSNSIKLPQTFFFEKSNNGLKSVNAQTFKSINDFSFFTFGQQINSRNFSSAKSNDSYTHTTMDDIPIGKRRKRRKFTTDEERRIATILKNRRTAEVSRQRRMQKMKDLENFAATFDEKEKKLREEIQYLGKQNSIQAAELVLLKEKLNKFTQNHFFHDLKIART